MPSDALTLSQLLAERLLVVPPFQRGYAWEDRQLDDLVEDLQLVELGAAGGHRSHYTGTVVLLERDGAPSHSDELAEPLHEAELVDGQQRMTTLVLLLHHLAAQLDEYEGTFAAGIRQRFVLVRLMDGSVVPKIRLHGELNELWQTHILFGEPHLRGPSTAAQERLAHASQVLAHFVERRDDESTRDHRGRLLNLHATISQHLLFNLYTVTDDADAGVVFETVNSRGKPLTELEKTKNYLMYAAGWIGGGPGSDLQERINTVWTEIYQQLMRFGLAGTSYEDQLLRSHWYLVEHPVRNSYFGAASIKRRYRLYDYRENPARLAEELTTYLGTLQRAALAFAEVHSPEHSEAFAGFTAPERENVIRYATRLARVGNRGNFIPLLVGARLRWQADPSGLAKVYDLCERLAFRLYRIRRARSDTGYADLHWLAHHLWHGNPADPEGVLEELRRITHRLARADLVFGILEAEEDWYHRQGVTYFLYEYEAHLTGARRMRREWGEVRGRPKVDSIEHILPQTPTGEWLDSFPDERERADLTHTLGNLMLTWDNSSYSYKPYARKRGAPDWPEARRCYYNGVFVQENRLAKDYDQWTPAAIRQRQQELVRFARHRWHVDEPSTLEPHDPQDDSEEDVDQVRPHDG